MGGDYYLVSAALHGLFINFQAGCRIRLRIQVNQQNSLTILSQVRSQVYCRRGLANTSFLISEGVDTSHGLKDLNQTLLDFSRRWNAIETNPSDRIGSQLCRKACGLPWIAVV